MAISTADLSAVEVMVNVAALMNDPAYTDYTFMAVLPYLNMAIEELNEHLEEANVAITNRLSEPIVVYPGEDKILNPPIDIIEIQEVGERTRGQNVAYTPLPRREFPDILPQTGSLSYWVYFGQRLLFNPNGANETKEVQLKYTCKPIRRVKDAEGVIGSSNANSFLSFKTAALCAQFIGEDSQRAGILNEQAEMALERIIGISNKGRQQIMTRHRPFRAGYKSRGY